MTREEFKQLESEEIERICAECPNYMDDNSTDSIAANSMLANFYSRIIEQMFNEGDEAKKCIEKLNFKLKLAYMYSNLKNDFINKLKIDFVGLTQFLRRTNYDTETNYRYAI